MRGEYLKPAAFSQARGNEPHVVVNKAKGITTVVVAYNGVTHVIDAVMLSQVIVVG